MYLPDGYAGNESKRYPEAFGATLRGAESGDIKAMYSVSAMYEHGRGTGASQRDLPPATEPR